MILLDLYIESRELVDQLITTCCLMRREYNVGESSGRVHIRISVSGCLMNLYFEEDRVVFDVWNDNVYFGYNKKEVENILELAMRLVVKEDEE